MKVEEWTRQGCSLPLRRTPRRSPARNRTQPPTQLPATARGRRPGPDARLSEISITLLWTEQGKASNRFRMLWQALQECTGPPQTQARWRLAAQDPGSARSFGGWRRARGPDARLLAGAVRDGTPGRGALARGPDGSSGLPRGSGDPDTLGQKPLKSQAHGAPARPALPRAASPRSPLGVEAAAPIALCSRRPGGFKGLPRQPGAGHPRERGQAVRPRRARQPRDPIPSEIRPAAGRGPHPGRTSSGFSRERGPPKYTGPRMSSDVRAPPKLAAAGDTWRRLVHPRAASSRSRRKPEAVTSGGARGRGYGRGRKSFKGCGGPGLRAGCRVLRVQIGAHVARAAAALPSEDQCASREAPLAPGVPTA